MKIAIIGTGNIGGTLGKKWLAAGHEIIIGARDINNIKGEALAAEKNVTVQNIHNAAAAADVILIATPAQVITSVINEMGDVKGKTIIDATNTVRIKPEGYDNAFEALTKLTSAGVVKCFNTTGFDNMANTIYNGEAIDMFMAGNNIKAKSVAKQLALETGFADCIDFGGDDKAALLEQLALCWINLAMMQGMGRDIAFKLVKR
jgi:8-hydroxy-5-deazaflavin:NADPH oxidoreductase